MILWERKMNEEIKKSLRILNSAANNGSVGLVPLTNQSHECRLAALQALGNAIGGWMIAEAIKRQQGEQIV